MLTVLKMTAVLVAAIMIGNMYMAEVRKAGKTGAPWYRPYITAPGILVFLAVLLPIIAWWFQREP